jgi:hypothetical protein
MRCWGLLLKNYSMSNQAYLAAWPLQRQQHRHLAPDSVIRPQLLAHSLWGAWGQVFGVFICACVRGFLANRIPMRRLPGGWFADGERGVSSEKPEKKRGSGGAAPGKKQPGERTGNSAGRPESLGGPLQEKPTAWQPTRKPLVCLFVWVCLSPFGMCLCIFGCVSFDWVSPQKPCSDLARTGLRSCIGALR